MVEARTPFASFYACELDPRVRRAFLLTGSNEVANDVVHDAFVALYPRYDSVDHPGRYLNQTVLNHCRNLARREGTRRRGLGRLAGSGASVEAEVDLLDDVLATLPFNQRAAVVLQFYGQFSHAETAAALGCPVGSIGPWISKALATMRRELR